MSAIIYILYFYKWYGEKDNKKILASSFFVQLHYAQNKTIIKWNSFFFNFNWPSKKIVVKKVDE